MRRRVLTSALLLAACARSPTPGVARRDVHAAHPGTPVARFGDQTITLEDLRERMRALAPEEAARLSTSAGRHAYVEEIADFELLADEAVRRGLADDPEIVAATKRMMVQRLLASLPTPAPTDAEIAQEYRAHADRFTKPAQYRLADLVLPASADAEKVRKRLAATYPEDDAALLAIARAVPGARVEADLRYQPLDALVARFGAEAAEAIRPLDRAGQCSAAVRLDDGVHLFWLRGKQRALTVALSEVKASLAAQLQAEARTRAIAALEQKLAADAQLTIDDGALEHLSAPAEATR